MTPSRKRRKYLYLTLGLLGLFVSWVVWSNTTIATTEHVISTEQIPASFNNFTIAHVSDLHNHDWGERLLNKIKAHQPDMIAVTGDLIDSSKTDCDVAFSFMEGALAIAPVYYVTGNHEAWTDTYPLLEQQLATAGVQLMDEQSIFIKRGEQRMQLVGLQDPAFAPKRPEAGPLSERLDETTFSLVLSHRPEHFDYYTRAGADLVLTGHAHGGQVRLPFIGGLVAPNQGLFPTYTAGAYTEAGTTMIVSRGLGHSIIPVRINNRPELIIIKLKTM